MVSLQLPLHALFDLSVAVYTEKHKSHSLFGQPLTKYTAMQNFDRSEIILMCWIGAQVTFLIINNIKKIFFDKWKVQKNSISLKSKFDVSLWMPLQPLYIKCV